MGSFSLMHWVVVLFIILIIFGAGKLPRVMGDFAKGIKAFKSGMKEEESAENQPQVTGTPGAAPSAAAPAGAHVGPAIRPGERASGKEGHPERLTRTGGRCRCPSPARRARV